MQTISTDHAETRTIAIAAPPAAVLAILGDARRLPEWAPDFARAVRPDAEEATGRGRDGGSAADAWIVDNGEAEFPIRLRVDAELGTVDILRPGEPPRGAFARVIPNGDGSEFLFTLVFPAGTDAAAIDAQMVTVERELATVRALSEADAPPPPSRS
jgi:uncharacterized protein YndB with AHSA1/START domain